MKISTSGDNAHSLPRVGANGTPFTQMADLQTARQWCRPVHQSNVRRRTCWTRFHGVHHNPRVGIALCKQTTQMNKLYVNHIRP